MRGVWLYVAVGAVAAAVGWVWWWVRDKQRLGLARVLELPWWMWPLTRLVVAVYKRELDKDIYDYTWHGYDADGRRQARGRWYIRIRRRGGRPEIKIRLGRGFPQGDEDITVDGKRINPKKKLVQQVTGVAGLGKLDYTYDFWLYRRNVKLRPRLVVPKSAVYHEDQDVREAFHKLRTKDAVPIAIGKGHQPVVHSWDDDAPHGLLSAITMGGGKTTTLRTVGIAAWLEGHEVLILDPIKQHSHTGWAINPRTGQPYERIFYADELEDAARQIIKARALMDQRNLMVKTRKRSGRKAPVFTRLVVLLDDGNGLTQEFKRHANPRHQRPNVYNEALDCFAMLLWCGREVFINIMAAFQRASAVATTGGDVREMFGLRMIAGTSDKTAELVADQVDKAKMPKPLSHSVQPGHCVMVYGTEALEAQRILISEDDCRAMIEQHLRALPARTGVHQERHPDEDRRHQHRELGEGRHRINGETDGDDSNKQDDRSGRHKTLPALGRGPLDGPQVEHAADNGDRSEQWADRDAENGDNDQDQTDKEVGVRHATHPNTRLAPVKLRFGDTTDTQPPLDKPRTEDHPSLPREDSLSQNNAEGAPNGFPVRGTSRLSMQEIGGGFDVGGRDGGIEYVTLGEIEGEVWCDLSAASMSRYARDETHPFPKAAIPGLRGQPAKFSLRAVREFFEDQEQVGDWGVYVVRPPGSATVKIGFTGNLKGRLRKWNLGAHCVLLWIPCESKKAAEALEDDRHRVFDSYHDHLEWFWYRGRLVEWVERELAERRQEVPV